MKTRYRATPLFLLTLGSVLCAAEPAAEARPKPQWREGLAWKVKTEYYHLSFGDPTPDAPPDAHEKKAKSPDYTYTVTITVAKSEKLSATDCWVLKMSLGDDAPDKVRGYVYQLWLAKDDLMPVRMVKTDGKKEVVIDATPLGAIRVIEDDEGFAPLFMVPNVADGTYSSPRKNYKVAVATTSDAKQFVATETRTGSYLPMETREAWPRDATFWKTYEFHSRGELRMKAQLLE